MENISGLLYYIDKYTTSMENCKASIFSGKNYNIQSISSYLAIP